MKKTAGLALVALILAAAAALFYYAFQPAAPGSSVAAPPMAVTPPPVADAPDTAGPEEGGSDEVAVAPPAVPTAPAVPSGPVEPAGLSAAGKKMSGRATVTGEGVNVRSTNEFRTDRANVVARAKKGERVRLIGAEKEKAGPHTWYHVRLPDGTVGWIREDLLKLE